MPIHESPLLSLWTTCVQVGRIKHEYDKDQIEHASHLFITTLRPLIPESFAEPIRDAARDLRVRNGLSDPTQLELF